MVVIMAIAAVLRYAAMAHYMHCCSGRESTDRKTEKLDATVCTEDAGTTSNDFTSVSLL